MKLRILGSILLLVVSTWTITQCGGGSGSSSATNTSTAQSQFNSPSGTLMNENATSLMNEALESSFSSTGSAVEGLTRLNLKFAGITKQLNIALKAQTNGSNFNCISGDLNNGEFDISCLNSSGLLGTCTGGGKLVFRTEGSEFIIEFKNNYFISCPDDDEDVRDCNGEIRIPKEETDSEAQLTADSDEVVCANLTCTRDGTQETFDGCVLGDQVLVEDSDGETYVCVGLKPNQDCSTLCSDWNDSQGSGKIECDVSKKVGTCPPATAIKKVSGCTFTRDQNC